MFEEQKEGQCCWIMVSEGEEKGKSGKIGKVKKGLGGRITKMSQFSPDSPSVCLLASSIRFSFLKMPQFG